MLPRGSDSSRAALGRVLPVALALALPALCLGQQAGSTGAGGPAAPTSPVPATNVPGGGVPAAELPGAALPGIGLRAGLSPMPADYALYGVAVGVGATDNVKASSSHSESQALAAANLFFDFRRKGSRLEAKALGNFSDINYLEHAYKNQVLGRFDGLANLTLWKRHLKWLVGDDYGDQETNPLQSFNPTNLQRVNIFSTGPSLRLQPTLLDFVEMRALYLRRTYQTSPFSSQAELGSFTIGHQFSPASSLSLVGQVEQNRFDNLIINRNYQVREYYGRYQLRGVRTSIDLQSGVSQTDDTGSWKSSPLVRFSLARNVSPFSSITLAGGREYGNAMGSFGSLGNGATGNIPIGAPTQTTANALHTYGNASWLFHRLRTTFDIFGRWERDAYDRESQYDVSRADLGLVLGRRLNPRLSAHITATINRSRYVNQGFTDNFGVVGAGLVYRPGEWTVIYGRYDHMFQRSSGVGRGLGSDENRIFVMIGYYPHSRGTAIPGMGGMGGGGFR